MHHIHRPAKTPKAWSALSRPDLLDRQAHALMLLANGRRGMRELSMLLGGDVAQLASELMENGYLDGSAAIPETDTDEGPPPRQ